MRIGRFLPRSFKNAIRAIVRDVISRIDQTTPQLSDVDALLKQSLSVIHHELNIPPLPPKHLQVRVVGGYVPGFVESGFRTLEDLNKALKSAGRTLNDFATILDFGCGCGRNTRALHALFPSTHLFGMDIDGEAIDWLTRNYSSFGAFIVAPHTPPSAFHDHQFDFTFGISVFTHLPEEMQFAWLEQLKRLSKPGGYVLLTTHGEKHYQAMEPAVRDIMSAKGFFYRDSAYGQSIALPAFYQNAYHSHEYIRREWGKYFDVLDIQPLGMADHQDTVLLRNRG